MTTENKPIHEIRLCTVKAAIWENQTVNGVRHSVTFSRIYRDGAQWKHADNFRRDELLLLAKLASLVHTWVIGHAQNTEEAPANV